MGNKVINDNLENEGGGESYCAGLLKIYHTCQQSSASWRIIEQMCCGKIIVL